MVDCALALTALLCIGDGLVGWVVVNHWIGIRMQKLPAHEAASCEACRGQDLTDVLVTPLVLVACAVPFAL